MGHHQKSNRMKEKEEAMKTKGYYYICAKSPNSSLKLQILKITTNPSSSSQSHVEEEKPLMMGWLKKAKRGHRHLFPSFTQNKPQDHHQLQQQQQQQRNNIGAYEDHQQVIQKKKKKNHKRFAEEINTLTFKKQKRIDHESSVPNNNKTAHKFSTQQLIRVMLRIGFNDKQVVDMILAREARLSRNKVIAQGGIVTGYDFKQNKSDKFKCDKSFSTHQGLGDHRSAAPCKNIEDPSKFSALGNVAAVRKENQCVDLVAKSFPTGWALRGHRTLHRPSPSVLEPPTIASTNSLATSDLSHSACSRKKLDFDLNEPPVLEQGETCEITSIVQPIQAAS